MNHLTVCIGYDSREPLTLEVLAHSIVTRASKPVTILPIALNMLRDVYTRTDAQGTTEFSLTRFLTPWLCGYQGWSLFMDSDMVVRTDIHSVFTAAALGYNHWHPTAYNRAVWVAKHDYVPKETIKATGAQTAYPRKNWSSVMLFRNEGCHTLTPQYVNIASPADLHRFAWLADNQIGDLPLTWNHLVGEYDDNPDAQVLHYTLGAPCFPGYEDGPMAELWWEEYRSMMTPMRTYAMPAAERYAREVAR